jgi:hypothetical protein
MAWLAWDRAPKREASARTFPPLEETAALRKKIEMREALVQQVLAKEITLFEAAAWFYRLNDEKDGGPREAVYRQKFPGRDDRERACRQVIAWSRLRLQEVNTSPSQVEAITGALEAELEEHVATNGKVVLPDGQRAARR